jgi:CyaY protein
MAQAHAHHLSEPEYRAKLQAVYNRVLAALDGIDPDVCEADLAQGALTIKLANGTRWVLSGQPPVRQLWLAVASRGQAFHFDYDAKSDSWRDDKGKGLEVVSFLEKLLREDAGVAVQM